MPKRGRFSTFDQDMRHRETRRRVYNCLDRYASKVPAFVSLAGGRRTQLKVASLSVAEIAMRLSLTEGRVRATLFSLICDGSIEVAWTGAGGSADGYALRGRP